MTTQLDRIEERLSVIEHALTTVLKQGTIFMSQIDDLEAAVAALKTATDNELAALNTIRTALEGSAAKSDPHVAQAIADIIGVTDRLNNAATAAVQSPAAPADAAPSDPAAPTA